MRNNCHTGSRRFCIFRSVQKSRIRIVFNDMRLLCPLADSTRCFSRNRTIYKYVIYVVEENGTVYSEHAAVIYVVHNRRLINTYVPLNHNALNTRYATLLPRNGLELCKSTSIGKWVTECSITKKKKM